MRWILCLLLSALAWTAPAEDPFLLVDGFDSAQGWSAVGRARVEPAPEGWRGAGLRLTLGGEPAPGEAARSAIVQGPNPAAAEAWEKGPVAGLDALVFHARASAPVVVNVQLRVRARDVSGPAGVLGTVRRPVAIAGGQWRRYSVRFEDFAGQDGLPPVGDALFRSRWPQVQFQLVLPAGEGTGPPVTVWVDELGFGAASESSSAETPSRPAHPGRDRFAEVVERFSAAAPTPVPLPAGGRSREELREQWVFVPWRHGDETFGEAATVSLPHLWTSPRTHVSGWYLRDFEAGDPGGRRVALQLERVPFFCAAFLNGTELGEHGGGFTPCEFDLTAALRPGRNRLALYVMDLSAAVRGERAVHPLGMMRPERIQTGSGIGGVAGRAWIETQPAARVADVFVRTSTRRKRIEAECELVNGGAAPVALELRFAVRRWGSGEPVAVPLEPRRVELDAGERRTVTAAAGWMPERPWSPEHPELHVLSVEFGPPGSGDRCERRFGFREFWIEGGRFLLNGVPVRLRGESAFRGHNDVPLSLNRAYLRTAFQAWKESFGVNAFRLHASIASQPVLEAADEAGMLLIHQSPIWSAMGGHYLRGGAEFLENARREFGEWARRDRNHPSVVIWDVENEQLRSNRREEHAPWALPLDGFVREWDRTRPISHSGAGRYAPDQDLHHVHMEEHYTRLFEIWSQRPDLPLVNGEYWVGGRGEARLTSSLESGSREEYGDEEIRLYHEAVVEQRAYGVSGVMPFTVSRVAFLPFSEGKGAPLPEDPADPDPRPAAVPGELLFNPGWLPGEAPWRLRPGARRPLYNALAPVTAFFWPRVEAAEAGGEASRTVVVCNDSETRRRVSVRWGRDDGESGRREFALDPAAQERFEVRLPAPEGGATATFFVEAASEGLDPARDELAARGISPGGPSGPVLRAPARLTDPSGTAGPRLAGLGVETEPAQGVPDPGEGRVWIIAPDASDRALDAQAGAVRAFLEAGGRILCLAQSGLPKWCPVRLNSWSSAREAPTAFLGFGWRDDWKEIYYSRHAPVYAPGHPVFEGLPFADLRWWNALDGRVSDDALARPAATGAVARGNWRPLLGASRRENLSLVEIPLGPGLLMLCPAHVVRESGHPEARRLLWNLLRYLDRPAAAAPARRVRVTGGRVAEAARLMTGASLAEWKPGDDTEILLAGPGADGPALAEWAARTGGTAVILSAGTSAALPGCRVARAPDRTYMAVRGEGHPLLWGWSAASFEDHLHPAVQGEFAGYPDAARVLLRGVSGPPDLAAPQIGIRASGILALDACGPAAVAWPEGGGTVIATTVEPFDPASPRAAELLTLLLTNAGVPLEAPRAVRPRIRALRTVPLTLDGRLEDWTNDVEDRNVSPHRHAEPVVLGADTVVAGRVAGDQQLSGIFYFLRDESGLCVAGVTTGAERAVVRIGDRALTLGAESAGWRAALGEEPLACASGEVADLRAFPDGRYLSFAEIDERVGHVRPVRGPVRGRSFELRLTWAGLGLVAGEETTFAVELHGAEGAVLRVPAGPEGESGVLVFAD